MISGNVSDGSAVDVSSVDERRLVVEKFRRRRVVGKSVETGDARRHPIVDGGLEGQTYLK